MEKQIMVQIDHVSKEYRLGAIGGTTLREDLARFGAKLRNKEDPTLKIGQSTKHYGERFLALDDISFEVYKGEAVGIIGRNGAGKSTLLKLLSRVTAPSNGKIGLNGTVASMLEVGTGFHPELTGRENIYMNGAILGMTRAEIDAKVEDIIDFSECRQFIDTPVKRYSSGMYVKLAFSVAAHLDSEIMIMDEVLAVGDMAFQQKCLAKMREAATVGGRTILYVSHNMNTIRQLCSRCVVLSQGKVIYNGDVEEAIGIYSNNKAYEDVVRTYSSNDHQSYITTSYLRLQKVEYYNKTDSVFEIGEPVIIRYQWKNNCDLNNIGLRLEIRTSDGTPLGVATSLDVCDSLNDTESIVKVKYDLSWLAPGRYETIITFFQNDQYGNSIDLDCVSGMDIHIKEPEDTQLLWRGKYWGNIMFPVPFILEVKSKSIV